MTIFAGSPVTVRGEIRNPITGVLEDAKGALKLLVVNPNGGKETLEGAEVHHDSLGVYHGIVETEPVGEYHYKWVDEGQVVDEGSFPVESDWDQGTTPDLTDLRVLVPRARRKCEGPWGNANGRPPLLGSELYAMIADACSEVIMLGGKLFNHTLIVKRRDPLVGYPTEWRTDAPLEEYESAIITAQVALDYYTHLFVRMRMSETVKNEGTEWSYSLSANLLRDYLSGLKDERDRAILGLRINRPLLDRFASNIRVRDQATVAVLEWWSSSFDNNLPGGLPGGQEAAVVPVFFPPGIEGGY